MKDALEKALEKVLKDLKEYFDGLPTYLKTEISHPRKKPRGSLRRLRKEQG